MTQPEEDRRASMEKYGFGPETMRRTRICPVCSRATTAEGPCCPSCGAVLPGETLYDRYRREHPCCPCCGAVLRTLQGFCPHCGARLKKEPMEEDRGGDRGQTHGNDGEI